MKWFNKDKTRMLDLDKVVWYYYQNPGKSHNPIKTKYYPHLQETTLSVIARWAQHAIVFHGEEATEIWEKLKSNPQSQIEKIDSAKS